MKKIQANRPVSNTPTAPLWSMKGLCIVFVLSLLTLWPMVVGQSIYTFYDTQSYLRGGAEMWGVLGNVLSTLWPDATLVNQSGGENSAITGVVAAEEAVFLRSIFYSMFAFAAFIIGSEPFLGFLQAFLVLFVAASFVTPDAWRHRGVLGVAAMYLIFATTLPWFSVWVMPDIFAAIPILFGAILVRRFDDLSRGHKLTLILMTSFAAATHYGNGPLVLGVVAVALLWRFLTRRFAAVPLLAGVVVVLFSPLTNIIASTAVVDEPSLAPMRLPILLARSLEDGPAYWYLQEACPEADLAFCEIFDKGIPSSVGDFLWGDDGIAGITASQMQRIREEEFEILGKAFLAYPRDQTASLFGNAAKQFVLIGLQDFAATGSLDDEFQGVQRPAEDIAERLIARFDALLPVTTWAAALFSFVLFVSRHLDRSQIEILTMCLFGLAVNAAIFGGLSFPVERYQSRVIWILPMLSGLFLAQIIARPSAKITAG